MSKQTAVEWLREKLMYLDFHPNTLVDVLQWFEQAKQMEKDQIVDAWHSSHVSTMTGEQYYEEKYGQRND